MISKVIFIGDPYRGDQAVNIEKTKNLFSPVLRELGLVSETCVTEINKSSVREDWVPVWKTSLGTYPVPIASTLELQGAAIIGFEAPDAELQYLSDHGVPWINLCLHPLRFLDDLHFEVATSFSYEIGRIAASLGFIEFCSNLIVQRYSHEERPKTSGALLVCGQDWVDRSIYFDGNFRRLDDYLPELDRLAATHNRVLYKPHPAFQSSEICELLAKRYGAELSSKTDIYELFVTENIETVCAISSSVLTEAPHFGFCSVFLEPRAKRYGSAVSYRTLIGDAEFWEIGFLGRSEISKRLDISFAIPANFLRKTFGSWSFVTDEMRIETRVLGAEAKAQQAEAKAQRAEAKAQQAEAASRQALTQLGAVYASTSWRMTAPLRWLFSLVRALTKRP